MDEKLWSELELDVVATIKRAGRPMAVSEMECCRGLNIDRWEAVYSALPLLMESKQCRYFVNGMRLAISDYARKS